MEIINLYTSLMFGYHQVQHSNGLNPTKQNLRGQKKKKNDPFTLSFLMNLPGLAWTTTLLFSDLSFPNQGWAHSQPQKVNIRMSMNVYFFW